MSITVGYSTRKSNPEFIEYLKKSSGFKKIQVIEKVNNGEKSLSQVYNEILSESDNDIVVLCHDDIYFDSSSWYHKLLKHFEKTDFGILGVAGTTYLPKSGRWWEDKKKMCGIVNHEHEGKKWESKYSEDLGKKVKETVIVDGLFIALSKSKIKHTFDESVEGFHFYDLNFCFPNHLDGVKVGVIFDVRITHKSIGITNQQWEENRIKFSEKYSNSLPSFIKKNINDRLRCLYVPIQNEDEIENVKKEVKYLSENGIDVDILLDEKKPIINLYNTIKNKKYLFSSPPGYRIGDGKWQYHNMGSIEISRQGVLYLISDPDYDFIILNSKDNYIEVLNLYSKTPKYLGFEEDLTKNHNSIKIKNNDIQNISLENFYELSNSALELNPKKVKIISGHSEKGGSTTSFIRLTNALNLAGVDTIFYGPHSWHIDKCRSGFLKDVTFEEDDIVIAHFLNLQNRPNVKKIILSLHEKNLFEISKISKFWDEVIFLNEKHREYHHGYNGEFQIIPNLTEPLVPKEKLNIDDVAGIIGTIDQNKQTHVSIQRAIKDGCSKIILFGTITQQDYFEREVKPLLSEKVIHYGYLENKQLMYDMVGRVYLSSISEVAPLVRKECELTNTKFFGNNSTNYDNSNLKNEEIIDKWIQIIQK
jgi:hypothetical protein